MWARKLGEADRTDLIGEQFDHLVGGEDPHVGRVEAAMEIVERGLDRG